MMLAALLVGQTPLAGSVVICTTEDGRAHLEKAIHHDHGRLAEQDHDHDHDQHHVDVFADRVLPAGACCRDISVDYASPSLVDVKRLGQDGQSFSQAVSRTGSVLLCRTHLSYAYFYAPDTGPDMLRSVILLV